MNTFLSRYKVGLDNSKQSETLFRSQKEDLRVEGARFMISEPDAGLKTNDHAHEVTAMIEHSTTVCRLVLQHFPAFTTKEACMEFAIPATCAEITEDMVSPSSKVKIKLKHQVVPRIIGTDGKVIDIHHQEAKDIRVWCSAPFKVLSPNTELCVDLSGCPSASSQIGPFLQALLNLSLLASGSGQPQSLTEQSQSSSTNKHHEAEVQMTPMWCDLRDDGSTKCEPQVNISRQPIKQKQKHGTHQPPLFCKSRFNSIDNRTQYSKHTRFLSAHNKVTQWLQFASDNNTHPESAISEVGRTGYVPQLPMLNKVDYWQEGHMKTRWKPSGDASERIESTTTYLSPCTSRDDSQPTSTDVVTKELGLSQALPIQTWASRPDTTLMNSTAGQMSTSIPHISKSMLPIPLTGPPQSVTADLIKFNVESSSIRDLPKKDWLQAKKTKRRGGALFDSI